MKLLVLLSLAFLLVGNIAYCASGGAMRAATPSESAAMKRAMKRDKVRLEQWQRRIERNRRKPKWMTITKNIVLLELVGLIDPMGLVIDEMAKGYPEDVVTQARARWFKLAISLTSAGMTSAELRIAVRKFAFGYLKGKAREKAFVHIEGIGSGKTKVRPRRQSRRRGGAKSRRRRGTASMASGFIYYRSKGAIHRIKPDGTGQRLIKSHSTFTYHNPRASSGHGKLFFGCIESTHNSYPKFTGLSGGKDTKMSSRRACGGGIVTPSPSGNYVFYTWNTGVCPNTQANRVNIDGTGDRAVLRSGSHERIWDASSDGRILYGKVPPGQEYSGHMYEANDNGTSSVRLSERGGAYHYMRYSPDLAMILYGQAYRSGQGDVFVVNRDGSGRRNLTNSGASEVGGISWSPDGNRIAYAWLVNRTFQIFIMNADGSGKTQITRTPSGADQPSWSGGVEDG